MTGPADFLFTMLLHLVRPPKPVIKGQRTLASELGRFPAVFSSEAVSAGVPSLCELSAAYMGTISVVGHYQSIHASDSRAFLKSS